MQTQLILIGALAAQVFGIGAVLLAVAIQAPARAAARRVEALDADPVADITAELSPAQRLLATLGGANLSQRERDGLDWVYRTRPADWPQRLAWHGAARLRACGGAAALAVITALLVARGNPQLWVLPFFALPAGAAAGWFGLRLRLGSAATARALDISANMTDALELMLICVNSGQGMEQSLSRVAAEIRPRRPSLADELERTIGDLHILGDADVAFRRLAERVPTNSIGSIVGILCQSLEYGSPLASALREVIDFARKTELLALEERAGKFPSMVTIPTLLFIFPSLLILLVGPAAIGLIGSLEKF